MPIRTLFALGLILMALAIEPLTAATLTQKKDGNAMTYRLVHPLHHIESTSKAVVYTVEGDASTKTISSVSGVVDVTTFDSGNSNRDSHAMEVIDALTFPEAQFVGSTVTARGDSLTVTGKLTFHGVTRDVTAHAVQQWSAEGLTVTGGFDISLTDFKIERPSLLMIPVQDELKFTFTAAFDVK